MVAVQRFLQVKKNTNRNIFSITLKVLREKVDQELVAWLSVQFIEVDMVWVLAWCGLLGWLEWRCSAPTKQPEDVLHGQTWPTDAYDDGGEIGAFTNRKIQFTTPNFVLVTLTWSLNIHLFDMDWTVSKSKCTEWKIAQRKDGVGYRNQIRKKTHSLRQVWGR